MADNRHGRRRGARTFSIGFLTALVSDELVPCERVLLASGWVKVEARQDQTDAGITVWEKRIAGNIVTACSMAINKMGQTASAIETYIFLQRCKPTELYLVGIAGSLQREWLFKRDVVVGSAIHWQTQDRIFGTGQCDEYRARPHGVPPYDIDDMRRVAHYIAEHHERAARNDESEGVCHVHFGEIFTWDYVIDSRRVVDRVLAKFPAALCVEMEAGGYLAAIARYSKVNGEREMAGLVVRGISDYADQKDWDEPARIEASRNAMKVAVDLAEYRVARRVSPIIRA